MRLEEWSNHGFVAHDIHLDRSHLNTSCRIIHPSPAMLPRMRLSPYSSRSLPFAHLCLPTNGSVFCAFSVVLVLGARPTTVPT